MRLDNFDLNHTSPVGTFHASDSRRLIVNQQHCTGESTVEIVFFATGNHVDIRELQYSPDVKA